MLPVARYLSSLLSAIEDVLEKFKSNSNIFKKF